MTSGPSNRYAFSIAALALVGLCTALYLSPAGSIARKVASKDSSTSASASASAAKASAAARSKKPATPSATSTAAPQTLAPAVPAGSGDDEDSSSGTTTVKKPATEATGELGGGGTSVVLPATVNPIRPAPQVPRADGLKQCWQYPFQQDAQAAYESNLSDPAGLDGAPGPYNGDGLACTLLAVDPSRAASSPIGQYVPPVPSAPTKAALVNPDKKYYGLTIEGVPFTTKPLDAVNSEVGKAPSMLQWFTNWNQTDTAQAAGYSGKYRADAVQTSWNRGALPIITWQSLDSGFVPAPGQSRTDQTAYTLANILNGNFDDYIRSFAIDIVKTNLPVGIRFDQEMNGDFYPWNQRAHLNGNSKGTEFAQMWRHVWQIFQDVGANNDVIWIWAPNRVDMLGDGQDKSSVFNRFYPGDQYVDWTALDAYWRYPAKPTDYAFTFDKTMNLLKHATTVNADGTTDKTVVNTKPIFFAEVGALGTSHDDPPVDLTAKKNDWITNMYNGALADPQVVGVAYFDNQAQQLSGDIVITNDWRIDSNEAVLDNFTAAVTNPAFSSGIATDGYGV